MKKRDIGMLAAACAMLYIAGTLRRPLFLAELSAVQINDFVLAVAGNSVFMLRMISVVSVLASAVCISLICRMAQKKRASLIAPLLFLSNFFIFIKGISGGSAAVGGFCTVAVITLGFGVLTFAAWWKKILAAVAGMSLIALGIHFKFTVSGGELQWGWLALLPWGIFLPVLVRNIQDKRHEILQNKLFVFGMYFTVPLVITAVAERRPDVLFAAVAVASVLLSQLVELTEKTAFDRGINYLAAAILPIPVLLFAVQTIGRFTDWIPAKYLPYMRGENYFIPVIALTLLIVWWKMAIKEENEQRKFLYVCAGVAFVLLALPNAIPVKYLRREAVQEFVKTTVKHIAPGKDAQYFAAGKNMREAVRWSFEKNTVGEYIPGKLQKGKEALIFTENKADVQALPHPKSYYTNGKFYIIHYSGRRSK